MDHQDKQTYHPDVFISYSWDSDAHKEWVREFADQLIKDGVNACIDQYDLEPGDRLPRFMEQIECADYVLVVCTPVYKQKADNRAGGVGYESNIITGELFTKNNEKKFLPILREGDFATSLPTYMSGKMGIDLRGEGFECNGYRDLLATILGARKKKPALGKIAKAKPRTDLRTGKSTPNVDEIKILGIITDEVTMPRMDGTRGCALYKVPFRLSRTPSSLWRDIFIREWDFPMSFSTMHRPGIARISGDKIILDGTTIEEVRDYHRDTLVLCVNRANELERQHLEKLMAEEERKAALRREHEDTVNRVAGEIEF